MAFILPSDLAGNRGDNLIEFASRHDRYREYLAANHDRFPPAAFAFAVADWHLNPSDHRCPHDAWVDSLTIVEPSTGDRSERRGLEIHVRLLGAYQAGYLNLAYSGVRSYALDSSATDTRLSSVIGHGDWLIDEVRLSKSGHVLHEVEFSGGGHWLIECDDIGCDWVQLSVPPMPPN